MSKHCATLYGLLLTFLNKIAIKIIVTNHTPKPPYIGMKNGEENKTDAIKPEMAIYIIQNMMRYCNYLFALWLWSY